MSSLVEIGSAKLASPIADGGNYEVDIDDHLAAVADEELHPGGGADCSYALAEWAAADRLEVGRSFDGIEDWGERLLVGNEQSWRDVPGEGRCGWR